MIAEIDKPHLPRDRKELIAHYGDPGTGVEVDVAWVKANLVTCHERGDRPLLPCVPAGRWIRVHRLIEPLLRQTLDDLDAECNTRFTRFACHEHRHQRHDARRPMSLHAWGVACDTQPHLNQARTLTHRVQPWSDEWTELWPQGITEAEVTIWEGHGWRWGGRWFPFCDPMHFEWYG